DSSPDGQGTTSTDEIAAGPGDPLKEPEQASATPRSAPPNPAGSVPAIAGRADAPQPELLEQPPPAPPATIVPEAAPVSPPRPRAPAIAAAEPDTPALALEAPLVAPPAAGSVVVPAAPPEGLFVPPAGRAAPRTSLLAPDQ